jgi:hypothetical protein
MAKGLTTVIARIIFQNWDIVLFLLLLSIVVVPLIMSASYGQCWNQAYDELNSFNSGKIKGEFGSCVESVRIEPIASKYSNIPDECDLNKIKDHQTVIIIEPSDTPWYRALSDSIIRTIQSSSIKTTCIAKDYVTSNNENIDFERSYCLEITEESATFDRMSEC